MREKSESNMKRRCFIKGACTIGAAATSACTAPLTHVTPRQEDNLLVVAQSEFLQKPSISIAHDPFPIGLYKVDKDTYVASKLECTHQSCQVALAESGYVCPCHGSRFSEKGYVLKGPAETGLENYRVTCDEAKIYIHLK